MINDQSIITAADMITQVFSNIDKSNMENSNKLLGTWKNILMKVHKYGERLAAHTELIDLKNGILLVETDHPGWIQIMQLYSKFILTGLQNALPDLHILSLAFRLKGSDASLCGNSYDDQIKEDRENLSRRLEEEDNKLGKPVKRDDKNKVELSPELKAKLDALKSSMLTNSPK